MSKKTKESLSIILLTGYFFTLFLSIAIYKNVSVVYIENVFISYMPLVFVLVYLILWAPFSMKIFYREIRIILISIAILLLGTIMIYVNIKRFEAIIGFNMCMIIIMIMAVLAFVMNILLIKSYKRINEADIDNFKQFILRDRNDYFETKEIKRLQKLIFFFRITCIVSLSVNNNLMFCISIIVLLFLEISLSNKILRYYIENKIVIKSYIKFIILQYLIYVTVLCIWLFNQNFIIELLLLFNCFSIPFLKEIIASQEFENYILLKGTIGINLDKIHK